jgi:hypothetical protein
MARSDNQLFRSGLLRGVVAESRTSFARMHFAPTRRARANKPRFRLRRSFALSLRSDVEVSINRLVNGKGAILDLYQGDHKVSHGG